MSSDAGGAARFEDLARVAGARLEARRLGEAAGLEGELRELLVLWLDGDPYALPVERVREIVRLRPITPVPHVPDAVRGVISLRGEIVQVIDLRRRLELPAREASAVDRRDRIVVLDGDDRGMAGLLVDRVSEVLRTRADTFRPSAARDSDTVTALVPCGEGFVSLFDVDRLLDLARHAAGNGAS
jgi:purine-binding chemotaxis protein CheW